MSFVSYVVFVITFSLCHEGAHILAYFLTSWRKVGIREALRMMRFVSVGTKGVSVFVSLYELGGNEADPRSLFDQALISIAGPVSDVIFCLLFVCISAPSSWITLYALYCVILWAINVFPLYSPFLMCKTDGQNIVRDIYISNPVWTANFLRLSRKDVASFGTVPKVQKEFSLNICFRKMTQKQINILVALYCAMAIGMILVPYLLFVKRC